MKRYKVTIQIRKYVPTGGSTIEKEFFVGPVNEEAAQWIMANVGSYNHNNDIFFYCTYEELNLISLEDFLEKFLKTKDGENWFCLA